MPSDKLTCIVDDNPDYRTLIHLFFKQSCPDHPVSLFADGRAFLDALPGLNKLPSLVLLDRHMPRLDGHQTLEVLKQHPSWKRIPVVMMSAHASKKEIDGCYDAGVNSFLQKSLDATTLQNTLQTICRYWLEMNQLPTLR